MRQQISELIAGYEAGISTREELVAQLAALAGERVEPADSDSTSSSIGLNHVALAVSNVAAMADFMGRHLGTSVIRASDSAGFLACGGNNFVGLFRRAWTGLDHVCFRSRATTRTVRSSCSRKPGWPLIGTKTGCSSPDRTGFSSR